MKIIRNTLLFLLTALLIFITAAIILAGIFEDEVTAYAIRELNKNLDTEISAGEVSLSLLRKLPDASIVFSDVLIKPSLIDHKSQYPDTLLSARQVMLSFNLRELLRKEYILKNIQLDGGRINILITPDGEGNYRFWKSGDPEAATGFNIDLQSVSFNNITCLYLNLATEQELLIYSKKTEFSGRFSQQQMQVSAQMSGVLHKYLRHEIPYVTDQELKLKFTLGKLKNQFDLSDGLIQLDEVKLTGGGQYLPEPDNKIDLTIRGQDIKVERLLELFPELKQKLAPEIRYSGQSDLLLQVSGKTGNRVVPHLDAVFQLEQGGIHFKESGLSLNHIGLNGYYNNGSGNNSSTSVVHIHKFSAVFKNSTIGGSAHFENFNNPEVEYKLKGDIKLSDLKEWLGPGDINLTGMVQTDLTLQGKQKSISQIDREDLEDFRFRGKVKGRHIAVKGANDKTVLSHIQGELTLNNHLIINQINGNFYNTAFSLSGRMDNLTEYFITQNGNLWADLDLYAEELKLDSLLQLIGKKPGDHKEDHGVFNADKLYLKLKFWIDEFSHRDFTADDIRGDLNYYPNSLDINRFEGSSMEGYFSSSGKIDRVETDQYSLSLSSEIDDINVTRMFTSFNNFGQEFILDQHISGDLSGNIDFFGEMDDAFKLDRETIHSIVEITVENGELIGFEPMLKLSNYIDIEELQHIWFSKLQNEIYISESNVIIPQMQINSSALNMTASGNHQFDGYYNYKIRLSLSDLLSKRFDQNRSRTSEFGIIEEGEKGRTRVYLSVTGTPDATDISYDRQAAVKGLRSNLNEEKELLKGIIKEEFGILDRDSAGQDISGHQMYGRNDSTEDWKREQFIITWEEDTINHSN